MNSELEKYLYELEVVINLKKVAKDMGFDKVDHNRMVKKDYHDIYMDFKDDHVMIWVEGCLETSIVKYYSRLHSDIDKGLDTIKVFITRSLNLF